LIGRLAAPWLVEHILGSVDALLDLQSQYSAALVVLACALMGVLVWAFMRNLPQLTLIALVLGTVWIVAMPTGLDAAKLVWHQKSMGGRVDCAKSLVSELDYWTSKQQLDKADCRN
jgi:hypothetical protein